MESQSTLELNNLSELFFDEVGLAFIIGCWSCWRQMIHYALYNIIVFSLD